MQIYCSFSVRALSRSKTKTGQVIQHALGRLPSHVFKKATIIWADFHVDQASLPLKSLIQVTIPSVTRLPTKLCWTPTIRSPSVVFRTAVQSATPTSSRSEILDEWFSSGRQIVKRWLWASESCESECAVRIAISISINYRRQTLVQPLQWGVVWICGKIPFHSNFKEQYSLPQSLVCKAGDVLRIIATPRGHLRGAVHQPCSTSNVFKPHFARWTCMFMYFSVNITLCAGHSKWHSWAHAHIFPAMQCFTQGGAACVDKPPSDISESGERFRYTGSF